ncbi:hypothetical protein [Moorena bouillonii]|uniref:Uncharacterized protein n=1 Tax=Moorena bouillonii PNG TaxID=568701 RepID=A0A1U7MYL4_9CYAN|nr:hypothetical protein [Moorena bouillonii]OLT58731.1 hypothetical protein BJP37_06430 [Moorena bouillonii PNG]
MNCTKFLKGGVGCEENEQRKLPKNGQWKINHPFLMQSASGGFPQDRNGALSVMARDCSPSRVAPLHRLGNGILTCSPW